MIFFSSETIEVQQPPSPGGELAKRILDGDQQAKEDAEIGQESSNQGVGSFVPSLFFENIVKSFSHAKQLYGEKLLQLITGYSGTALQKNIRLPEFKKELKAAIEQNIQKLKERQVLDENGVVQEKAHELASMLLFLQEMEQLDAKGYLGEKKAVRGSPDGDKKTARNYKKGDLYKNTAILETVQRAIKRGHTEICKEDLKVFDRETRGSVAVVYALDASASMRGEKLATAKRAGVALAYKTIQQHDKIGLIVFGSEVKEALAPTDDFHSVLSKIARVTASQQTNVAVMIQKAAELFPNADKKLLLILTDALPTAGKTPEQDTLHAVSAARAAGITVSLIGIGLDKFGRELAHEVARIGEGRLYSVKNLQDVDTLVLEEYERGTS